MKTLITPSQVIEQLCCPYCGNEFSNQNQACCGEAGHGELMYATDNDSSWMSWDEFTTLYEIEG